MTHILIQLYDRDMIMKSSRWADTVKTILVSYGLGSFWISQSTQAENKELWETRVNKNTRRTFKDSQKQLRLDMPSAKTMIIALEGRKHFMANEKIKRTRDEKVRKRKEKDMQELLRTNNRKRIIDLNRIKKQNGEGK